MLVYKKPKIQTIIAFLQSKGWSLEKETRIYHVLKPPKDLKFQDSDFRYYVPVTEKAMDYEEFTLHLMRSMAQLYELNFQDLIDLLSKSLEEIENEVENHPSQLKIKKAMLAYAS